MRDPYEQIYQAELANNVSMKLEELAAVNPRAAGVGRLHILEGKTQQETAIELRLTRDKVAKAKPDAVAFLTERLKDFGDYR